MSYTLNSLKNSNRSTEKLTQALAQTQKKFQKDERYWQLTVDKAGNGYAIIRFLDAPKVDGEDGVPFVQLWSHGFQGPGGWYIENSLTTNKLADPVSEYNSDLWATGLESNKKIASAQKRQLNYISNILVVKDPANPENEGKVFLYRYGKTIFDMIEERLPELHKDDAGRDPDFLLFNPYNFWNGANFKLKARIGTNKRRTYDKSEFMAPAPISDDTVIEGLWSKSHSLKAEIAPNKFKTYEELKARLDKVLGLNGAKPSPATTAENTVVETDVVEIEATAPSDDAEMDVFRRLADD